VYVLHSFFAVKVGGRLICGSKNLTVAGWVCASVGQMIQPQPY